MGNVVKLENEKQNKNQVEIQQIVRWFCVSISTFFLSLRVFFVCAENLFTCLTIVLYRMYRLYIH